MVERIAIAAIIFVAIVALLTPVWVLQLSVRIVAGYRPRFGNVLLAIIAAFLGCAVVDVVLFCLRVNPFASVTLWVIQYIGLAIVTAAIYGLVIKGPNGVSLGFLKAFLAEVVYIVICLLPAALFLAVSIRLIGYNAVMADFRQGFSKSTNLQRSIYSAARSGDTLKGIHWPIVPQNSNWLFPQATPAPVRRYYLKAPVTVRVSYGTITIPANTEVRVIEQTGDSSQIQIGNATYTVNSSQLVAIP
ncbi:MAG: hypothetical protein ABSF34_17965 [Verrucomicrobiota bacterium]